MRITLELIDDQSDYDADALDSSIWLIKLNGLPIQEHAYVTLKGAHKIVGKLMDIEELLNE